MIGPIALHVKKQPLKVQLPQRQFAMLLKQRNGPFTQDASEYSWVPNKRACPLISESQSTLPTVFHMINAKCVHPFYCFSSDIQKISPPCPFIRDCPFIRQLRVDGMIGYWSFYFVAKKKASGTLNNWYWSKHTDGVSSISSHDYIHIIVM